MTGHEATRWPFDIDAVHKGATVLSAEQIDNYANAPRESKQRRLATLQLLATVRRALHHRGDGGWTVCEREEAIVVLTDAEASPYNQKRTDDALRVIAASTARLVAVDPAALTAEESAEHERRVMRNSYLTIGLRAARIEYRKQLRAPSEAT